MITFVATCEARFAVSANPQGVNVKTVISLLIAASLACGCVAGSQVSHEDSPAATKRDAGPTLCRDGTTPPCNDRD
jgi:hypothetical protein